MILALPLAGRNMIFKEGSMRYFGRFQVCKFLGSAIIFILSFGTVESFTVDSTSWIQQNPSQSPPIRYAQAMVYDAAHGQVVLFGGTDISTLLSDTWTWDGTKWMQMAPANSPPARCLHAMAYDALHGQVVLFGGYGESGDLSDTWTWDGSNWTVMTPANNPPAREYHAMAYDTLHGQVILFGGNNNLSDTWSWDGRNWTKITPPNSPSARYGHAMAYDALHGQVVLFGGVSLGPLSDTWTWDGKNWMKMAPTKSPSYREVHAMAYDALHGQVVLFGGSGVSPHMSDTWTWDGSTWTQKDPQTSPSGRWLPGGMAYDTTREQMVLFGGKYYGSCLNDTWIFFNSEETSFVPIVLTSAGLSGSYFTSEMTLTNRGTNHATINFYYKDALGNGLSSGTAAESMAPGTQWIIYDAIAFLRSHGIPIPSSGSQGGTLKVSFTGLSAPRDAGVTVRTTTAVSNGRVGLAYSGALPPAALVGPAYLCGLRQNSADRSNVALQNMGSIADGKVMLRLTVYSGDSTTPASQVLSHVILDPGEWTQINGILTSNGLAWSNGYVRVERIEGSAPFYAYAVINDQFNSDGSFVPPLLESSLTGKTRITLPVIVEVANPSFSSELSVTNWSATAKTLSCRFVADAITTRDHAASFTLSISAGEQKIISNFVDCLRNQGVTGIGPAGSTFAGALFIAASDSDDLTGISVAARTSSPGGGGEYGLFYTAVPVGAASTADAWLYGLQQNTGNRTNLALVNTAETDENSDTFQIELYNGGTGTKVATVPNIVLNARSWHQFNAILSTYASGTTSGYAHITRTAGNNPFIAYAVINDGAVAGQRTGDGAFILSAP
jgi:hypothetical protein